MKQAQRLYWQLKGAADQRKGNTVQLETGTTVTRAMKEQIQNYNMGVNAAKAQMAKEQAAKNDGMDAEERAQANQMAQTFFKKGYRACTPAEKKAIEAYVCEGITPKGEN